MKNHILILMIATVSLLAEATMEEKTKSSESIYLKSDTKKPTKCYYKCPEVKDGYRARIKSIDYQNGTTYCYVYEENTNELLSTVKQVNDICKDKRFEEKNKIHISLLSNDSERKKSGFRSKIEQGFLNIKEQKDFYFGSYIDTGDKEFLDASKYMIAGLTLDNNIIDIDESINKNMVVLQDEYTMYPNAKTNYHTDSIFSSILSFFTEATTKEDSELVKDDSTRLVSQASSLLSNITVFIMHFMGDYNEHMLGIKAFLFFTILPFTGLFILQSKITKKMSSTQDYDDVYERIFYTALTLFIFYFSTSNIKLNNRNFDEQAKISQSNFQNWFRTIFYEGAEFATEIARVGTTSYLKYKIQDIGVTSRETLLNQKLEKQVLENEQQALYSKDKSLLDYCYKTFKTDELKNAMRIYSTFNNTFPNKEYVVIDNNALGEMVVNWYIGNTFINEGFESTVLSANGCYNIERQYLYNKAKLNDLNRDIAVYTKVSQDVSINKQLEILAKTQYRNSAELGWIGFTMIPTMNIAINELQIIDKSARNEADENKIEQSQKDSENTNKIDKDLVVDSVNSVSGVIGKIAYMSLPMADSIYNIFRQGGKNIIEQVTTDIPFLGSVIGKLTAESLMGKSVETVLALIITVTIMKFLVSIFPLIGIIMAGVMAIAYYFVSVEIYYIVSPFLIAFAMASQQGDIIKKFLKVGVTLALKPIMIVISLVIAIWVFEFFNVFNQILVDWNFDSIFAVKNTSGIQPINSLFLSVAKEFIHIGINIVALFVVFYIVLSGANMIMDMFGVSDANVDVQSTIGSNIDNKSARWNNGGI